jgi:hypothetical protein
MEVEVEVSGQVETECVCPKCSHRFRKIVEYSTTDVVEIDPSDFAPDHDWRD